MKTITNITPRGEAPPQVCVGAAGPMVLPVNVLPVGEWTKRYIVCDEVTWKGCNAVQRALQRGVCYDTGGFEY